MRKKLMWNVAAATVIELAVMTTTGYSQIGAAQRAQKPQIEKKDVVLVRRGDRPVARTDDRVGKALKSSGFKIGLQSARFGEAKAGGTCAPWICGSNSPIVDGAAIVARPARRHQAQQLTEKDVVLVRRGDRPVARPYDRARKAFNFLDRMLCYYFDYHCAGPSGCSPWVCGSNSPIVDGAATTSRAFHELNLAGAPNAAGFAVVGVRKENTAYALEVKGATVSARPQTRKTPRLIGAALAGIVLDLRDVHGEGFALQIASAATTTYWAGAAGAVPTYTLTYTSATQHVPRPLCTASINEAILFTGDRYDAARKTVTATGAATRGWVNVACAGTALAKLYLLRHTEASQSVPTTPAERQAMFKMLTGDYCGDGTSFTVHGQPLLWSDAKGITKFARTPESIEAVWNENGAVCLDQPRRPELAAAMNSRCGPLPRCSPGGRGHVTSANPYVARTTGP